MHYTTQELVEAANNPSALLAIAKELNSRAASLDREVIQWQQRCDQKERVLDLLWSFLVETDQVDAATEFCRWMKEEGHAPLRPADLTATYFAWALRRADAND